MANIRSTAFCGIVAVIALFVSHVHAEAIQLTYCSSQNTGSDQSAQYWTWQSNGWCGDACKSQYAFSIVQGNNCWCSNYAPADQVDTGDCNKNCPGFPDEKCGSQDGTLFGYVQLNVKPSGTQGGSQPSSQPTSANVSPSSTPAPAPSSSSPPEEPSSSEAPPPETTTSQKPTSAAPAPAPASSTLQTSASESQPTKSQPSHQASASPSTEVIYISGAPVTRTIYADPPASTAPADTTEKQNKGSSNVAAIAGGVVGGIAGLAAIVGAIFFVLWRRRKQQREAENGDDPSGITRNVSTMSKAGLLRSEKNNSPQYPPPIVTHNSRSSRYMGDGDSISPISGSDRRSSRPFVFDQRLNPSTVLMNLDNNSRASFNSIDDSRDYGRTLNVRNPDPDP